MITDSFDEKSKPIISLKDIYGAQKHLTDVCIITFSEFIYKAIIDACECKKIAEINACNGNIPIYAFRENERVIAFYLSPIGATMASECLAEVNWLTGASKFIMFGSAGSLDGSKTAGKFIIPTQAYRGSASLRKLNWDLFQRTSWKPMTSAFIRRTVSATASRRCDQSWGVPTHIVDWRML